jgi:hypothetical protein
MLFLCASPVSAVTYSEEYYSLGSFVDKYFYDKHINNTYENQLNLNDNIGNYASLASARELRRQTILLEKQNELLMEQIKAQWVETCYAPKYSIFDINRSAWKSECANAGYPLG